jgi:hypothetical protein
MIAFENRAATVLYRLFKDRVAPGPVLLPANVCPIVPLALLKAGQRYEFIDISLKTLCIDHALLIDRWKHPADKPSGLVYVRTYGAIEAEAASIFSTLRSINPQALLIDDRCACPPSFEKSSLLDGADAVLYSTGYAKYADIGFGGYAFLDEGVSYSSKALTYDAASLHDLTKQCKAAICNETKFTYTDSPWLDGTQPAVTWREYRGLVEKQATKVAKIKSTLNSIYREIIPAKIQLDENFQSWRFNIKVGNKFEIMRIIESAGLFASGHYDALAGKLGPGSGTAAEINHSQIINLFNDIHFDEGRATRLANLVKRFSVDVR